MMMMRGYNNNRTQKNNRNKRNNHDNTDLLLFVAAIIGLISCNYDVSSFVLPSSSSRSKTVIIRRITHYTPLPMSDDMFPLVQLSGDKEESTTNTNDDDAQKDDQSDQKDDDQSDDNKDGEQEDDADDGDMDWLSGPPADAPEMEIIECDVAIIGGGPAGATCALYTSRADLSTVILDKNEAIGALAITSHIANYPGVDRAMTGIELLQQMKTQAIDYGTRICDRAQVFMIEIPTEDEACSDAHRLYNKIVYTPDYTVKARSLVLATGAMGRSMPYLPGEEKYLGQGVSYCATCDGAFYRNSEVAVFGATNEALEEAMFLTKFASTVHWITPIDVTGYIERLEAHKLGDENNPEFNHMFDEDQLQHFLSLSNVKHHNKARLREVQGDMSGVTGVRIRHQGDKKEQDVIIPSEGAFIYGAGGGSKPITDFLSEGSGITLDDGGGVVVNDDMESISKKGIFAIGDIRNTPYKQVVVAAADGCVAAMSIEKFLKNRKTIKLDWIHK